MNNTRSNSLTVKMLCALGLVLAWVVVPNITLADEQPKDKVTAKDVQQEMAKTYQTLKSYSVEQRNEALSFAKTKMADLDRQIDATQQQIDRDWQKMSQKARKEARATLKELQQERQHVAEWYGGLQHSSAAAWEDVKKGFFDSYKRLEKAFENAKESFKKGS